jgi:multidrug efflux system membrane fusion protein
MKKLIYFILLIVVIFLAYRYFCPKKLDVALVTRGPAVKAVYATGTVESSEMLPIAPRVSGRLEELLVDEGESVKEGDVLARLESRENNALKVLLESRLEISRKEFLRQENLIKSGATTKEVYDKSKSELEVSKASLEAENARKEYLDIKAPKDGQIIRRDGEIGQYVQSNQSVFWFTSNVPLRITADVDEEDISQVKEGLKVLIRSDAFKDRVFEGSVTSITPKGDPVARTYRVRIGFKEEVPLMIGMTAENNIIIREEENALLVPTTSVLKDEVFYVNTAKASRRKIKSGAKGAQMTEILEGLVEGDHVLVNFDQTIKDDTKIRENISEKK